MLWLQLLEPALACSVFCEPAFAPDGLVVPADGAVDVPLDAHVVVASRWGGPPRLLDPDGEEVAVEVESLGDQHGYRLIPEAELQPLLIYTVVDEEGADLGAFRAGTAPASAGIAVPGDLDAVGTVKFDLIPGHELGASCGGLGEGVLLDATWTATTGLYEVRVDREDGRQHLLLVGEERASIGWTVPCVETVPDLKPKEVVEIRVRSVDAAGRAGEWSDPLVTSARAAEPPGGCATVSSGAAGSLGLAIALLLGRRRRTDAAAAS